MAAMNIVHMRVKPGREADFIDVQRQIEATGFPGALNFWMVRTGARDFTVVGEWQSMDALIAARPAMIANLDKLRDYLEDLGDQLGVTDPRSGEVVVHLNPGMAAASAM